MATTVITQPLPSTAAQGEHQKSEQGLAAGLVTTLAALAMAVHGYHPYAEDGGLYMAGIKWLLDPTMYPRQTEFVTEHLRFSIFAPFVAGIVHISGLSVEMVLLLVQFASFWMTLFAGWKLAERCYASREARAGAVALLAMWLTLPVAGTSLMLMDQYVTARSISTPCSLVALAGALAFLMPREIMPEERWRGLILCIGSLMIAALFHPLMAGYALLCVLTLACVLHSNGRVRAVTMIGLFVAGVSMAAILQWTSTQSGVALPENVTYLRAALTRHYWFLSQWHWYELIGLVAPLAILVRTAVADERNENKAGAALARMAVVAGITAVTVALLFARIGSTSHLVARLQPLRIFQTIYVVMILAIGAEVATRLLKRSAVRWVAMLAVLATVMVVVERQTFPSSAHIELPTETTRNVPKNEWLRAFLWIRQNTPKDALFALDADYITKAGEDAQCFRAIAERSALPDYSKDGGEASITPALTAAWSAGQTAQTGLSTEPDSSRMAALRPFGVNWVVLERNAATKFLCEYANDAVKVCRLPW